MPNYATLRNLIVSIAKLLPKESYLVGGFVRDYLLKRQIEDVDISLKGDVEKYSQLLAKEFNADFFGFKKENLPIREKVYTLFVPVDEGKIRVDLSECKDLKEDLFHRDFTVNAMAWNIHHFAQGKRIIFDPFGGERDLRERVIRAVRLENFLEDPLRMLRAYRFAISLNFTLGQREREFIRKHAPAIKTVAGERIVTELLKVLSNPSSDRFFYETCKDGFLPILVGFPVYNLKPTLLGLRKLNKLVEEGFIEKLAQKLEWQKKTFLGEFGEEALLRLLIFLKNLPPKRVKKFVERYPFGSFATDYLLRSLEGYHLLMENPPKSVADLYDYLKRFEKFLFPIGVISKVSSHFERFSPILEFYRGKFKKFSTPLLSGKDILRIGKIKPSPLMGIILKKLVLAQLEGKVKTREEAEEFVKNLLRPSST
ncbi:MAG TPA: CCA tRNA nucleotidyltransferase [Aquifex sp.]|nr:CCA tRNA nucleotidyltransferase [Aquifex sp.]